VSTLKLCRQEKLVGVQQRVEFEGEEPISPDVNAPQVPCVTPEGALAREVKKECQSRDCGRPQMDLNFCSQKLHRNNTGFIVLCA